MQNDCFQLFPKPGSYTTGGAFTNVSATSLRSF